MRAGPDDHFDAGGPKPRKALTGDQRIGVCDRRYDARDAGGNQRITTRPCPPVMRAGFQSDPGSCASCGGPARARIAQSHDFSMGTAGLLGVAEPYHRSAGIGQNRTHCRIGRTEKTRQTGLVITDLNGISQFSPILVLLWVKGRIGGVDHSSP